ncbi:hypothetical protein OF83DRAFT_1179034 [Amylostereum chailletii]|nr:hypothetical protein OF83DRAFT_1179034 [Amylostereum chailletii]
MAALSANMVHLILEAKTALCQLEHLKAHLGTLHELVACEDGVDGHRAVLVGASGYCARALAHVVVALQTL